METKVQQLRKVVDGDSASENTRVEELVAQAERKVGYTQDELDGMQHLTLASRMEAIVFDSMFDDP